MQKIKCFVLLFLCLFFSHLIAQTSNKNFFYSQIKGNTTIVTQKAITRIAPSIGAAVDDSLAFGTPMQVLMIVPYSESLNGLEIPWVKCIYKKGEFNKVTFVMANQLALKHVESNNTSALVYFKSHTNDSLLFEIKIINQDKKIDYQHTLSLPKTDKIDSFKIELINPSGLKNVCNIFRINAHTSTLENCYNFIECSQSSELLCLEKSSKNKVLGTIEGKNWNFPSNSKLKKNQIMMISYSNNPNNSFPSKIYKFRNCGLQ